MLFEPEVGQEGLSTQLVTPFVFEGNFLCFLGFWVEDSHEQLLLGADDGLTVCIDVTDLIGQQVLAADHLDDIVFGHEHLLGNDGSQLVEYPFVPLEQGLVYEFDLQLGFLFIGVIDREDADLVGRMVQGAEELLLRAFDPILDQEGV